MRILSWNGAPDLRRGNQPCILFRRQSHLIPASRASTREALHEIELHDRLWADFFARAGIVPLHVTYEDMEADPAAGMRRLLGELGLPVAASVPRVSLRRQRGAYSATLRERFLGDFYRL